MDQSFDLGRAVFYFFSTTFAILFNMKACQWIAARNRAEAESVAWAKANPYLDYEEFRRDALDRNVPVEVVVKRCGDRVPEMPPPAMADKGPMVATLSGHLRVVDKRIQHGRLP